MAREARSLPALVPAPVTGEHLSENRVERVIGSRGEAHQLRSLHLREPRLDDSSDDVDAVSGAQLEESLEPIPIKARSLTAPVLADVSAGAIFPRGSVATVRLLALRENDRRRVSDQDGVHWMGQCRGYDASRIIG